MVQILNVQFGEFLQSEHIYVITIEDKNQNISSILEASPLVSSVVIRFIHVFIWLDGLFYFFFPMKTIPLYEFTSLPILSPIEGHPSYFQYLTIINKAAINICVLFVYLCVCVNMCMCVDVRFQINWINIEEFNCWIAPFFIPTCNK